jgi:hypothetical protein
VITTSHVTFNEHTFPFHSVMLEQSPSWVTVHHPATDTVLIQPPPPAVLAAPAQPSATAPSFTPPPVLQPPI